jgi:ribosomal protein S27E
MTYIFLNEDPAKKEEAVLIEDKNQEYPTVNIPKVFWPQPAEVAIMKDVLKKIFKAHPGKSTITVNGKCSDCGNTVIVIVELTSGGYGLLGGILDKSSSENYSITCIDCHKSNLKITDRHDASRKLAL